MQDERYDWKNLKIQQIRSLTENTYVLRLDRNNIPFKAGQYITLGFPDTFQHREYSIYSSENDNYFEVIIREVLEGHLSVDLKQSKVGQLVEMNGPFGYLTINKEEIYSKKFIFIATGTGIAPFHSFISSYPGIDYKLLHGVRYANEAYEKHEYDSDRYILCTSKENNGSKPIRVTEYLSSINIDKDSMYYVCGNSKMIYEVYDILRKNGVNKENIRSEVYF